VHKNLTGKLMKNLFISLSILYFGSLAQAQSTTYILKLKSLDLATVEKLTKSEDIHTRAFRRIADSMVYLQEVDTEALCKVIEGNILSIQIVLPNGGQLTAKRITPLSPSHLWFGEDVVNKMPVSIEACDDEFSADFSFVKEGRSYGYGLQRIGKIKDSHLVLLEYKRQK
jgi:hypothetical protein